MNSKPRSLLIAALVLATAGSAGLAWQQYKALTSLRAGVSNPDDTGELQRRLTEAEQRAHDLENELATLRGRNEADTALPDDGARPPPAGERAQGGPRDGSQRFQSVMNSFDTLMENPDFARMVNAEERSRLDGRFASLFKQLADSGALTPLQVEAFKDLLVEKQNAARDTRLAALANGITDRGEIRKLTQNAQAEVDKQIQTQLGAAAYQQYKSYEQTQPQRAIVNQLSQRLSYSTTPLNDSQSQRLVQILADTAAAKNSASRNAGTATGRGGATSSPKITDEAISRAQGILNASQLIALRALQDQQRAQQQIADMMLANATQKPTAKPTTTSKQKIK